MSKRLEKGISRTLPISIQLDGESVQVYPGETIATAIVNEKGIGYRVTKEGKTRGPICNMGVCYECTVNVTGLGNVRACMTNVKEGMQVSTESRGVVNADKSEVKEYQIPEDFFPTLYDVVIIGAGPAGLGAIEELINQNLKIAIVDEQTQIGGQIYRQPPKEFKVKGHKNKLIEKLQHIDRVDWMQATVVTGLVSSEQEENQQTSIDSSKLIEVSLEGKPSLLAKRVIIGTGAYDRLLTIPGWDLPGVMSAGGIQLFIKSQGYLPGEKIFLTGNHPFILVVAEQIIKAGGHVVAINFAQSFPEMSKLVKYGLKSIKQTRKVRELLSSLRSIRKAKVPIIYGEIPTSIKEEDGSKKIILSKINESTERIEQADSEFEADVIGMCFGFKASSELARQAGCDMRFDFNKGGWIAEHNHVMESTVQNVFVAGEITGIGGADLSEIEGRLAGHGVMQSFAIEESTRTMNQLLKKRKELVSFSEMLIEATSLPMATYYSILKNSHKDTVICKCEMVTVNQIEETLNKFPYVETMNAVKLSTRCGMGLCQGRYCEDTLSMLLDSREEVPASVKRKFTSRHPIKPVTIRELIK